MVLINSDSACLNGYYYQDICFQIFSSRVRCKSQVSVDHRGTLGQLVAPAYRSLLLQHHTLELARCMEATRQLLPTPGIFGFHFSKYILVYQHFTSGRQVYNYD